MNIFRNLLVGLASLIFIVSVTGFTYVYTLHTTLMDRTVVKSWLNESGLYDGRLIGALIQTTNAGGGENGAPQPATDTFTASPDAIKTAMNATFTPDFTKTQIEGVIDSAFNWMDGTTPQFTFSIPIDQKRDTLIAELAKALHPQVAALPICQSAQGSVCRPANISVEQLATQMTTDSITQSDAFAKPITNESFAGNQPAAASNQPSIAQLPALRTSVNALLAGLPIAALISLVVIVFATTAGQRLSRSARLARRVFFGMVFIFLPTALVLWLAKDNDLGLSSMFAAQTSAVAVPLIKTIGVGLLAQLALVSGIIGAISAAIWILLNVWQHQLPKPTDITAPDATVPTPPKPATTTPTPPSDPPTRPLPPTR